MTREIARIQSLIFLKNQQFQIYTETKIEGHFDVARKKSILHFYLFNSVDNFNVFTISVGRSKLRTHAHTHSHKQSKNTRTRKQTKKIITIRNVAHAAPRNLVVFFLFYVANYYFCKKKKK